MFAGLDDIDWAAMDHAYGPATEVPDLLRGLVSDDPATRETALDGMYGAVHHQGDVYDCTLAAAHPLFLDLLADADVEVRRAAPAALLVRRAEAAQVVAALWDRLTAETDPAARAAIVGAAGSLGRLAAAGRLDVDAVRVQAWLAELAAQPGDPAFRLAVIAELARGAPGALPSDLVPVAVELLRATYAASTPPGQPAGFSTDTLIGTLRELREQEAAGRRSPEAAELVSGLSHALGDRVEDRVLLLTELLGAPDPAARLDAIRPARVLVEGWRGSYEELVALIGERLADPQPDLPALAASALEHLGALAAPAADALARSLDAGPREAADTDGGPSPWITLWQRSGPSAGPTLRALAALGDRRALPAVRWALERPDMPRDIGYVAGELGPAAADLVPGIRRRLRELPHVDGHDQRRDGLVFALGRIGEAAAAASPELLALVPDRFVLRAIGRMGSAAAAAAPGIRGLLRDREPAVRIAAASALWRVDPDPELVLPVLAPHLEGDDADVGAAAEVVAEVGRAAAAMAPRLRDLLRGGGASAWLRLRAAEALWRVTGDPDTALPTLLEVWSEDLYSRGDVARHIAEMGPAARAAAPLLREELGLRRRYLARDGTWSSDQVTADLALLRACGDALAAAGL